MSNDFFEFLTRQLEAVLREDVSKEGGIETEGSIQDFIAAPRTRIPDQTLLLDLVQQLPCNGNPKENLLWAVEDSSTRELGFSNKSPEEFTPNRPKETKALLEVIAALVIKKRAQDESYKRHIIKDMIRNVVACCEDQLINGESQITGLLYVCSAPSITREKDEGRMTFYRRALKEYANKAGRAPTHIVLPFKEILQLHVERPDDVSVRIEETALGFSNKLFGIPVIVSDALPRERGLILAVDDIILVSFPGLRWMLESEGNILKTNGLAAITLSFTMGLTIKYPQTVARLTLENNKS